VPAIAIHALADAVAVVGGDVLAALSDSPDDDLLTAVVETIREALEQTR